MNRKTPSASAPAHGELSGLSLYVRAFLGLLLRDGRVLLREFIPFAVRAIMNPLFLVFVFAYIFPKSGQGFQSAGGESFATILLPGLVGMAIFFQGVTAVALPLSVELGGTREIEDRLMTPLPIAMVAIEKVIFSALQSILAALIVFPLVYLVPVKKVSLHVHNGWLLAVTLILASLAVGSLGLLLGTSVKPKNIGLMFSVVLIPITFLGCVYYPWVALQSIPWLQSLVLINPLVYISEALRAALTPSIPHMPVAAALGAIFMALAVLTWLGIRGFKRRVIS